MIHLKMLLRSAETEYLRTIRKLLLSVTLPKEILLNSLTNTFSFLGAFIISFGDNLQFDMLEVISFH
jgi:hypothetical protein